MASSFFAKYPPAKLTIVGMIAPAISNGNVIRETKLARIPYSAVDRLRLIKKLKKKLRIFAMSDPKKMMELPETIGCEKACLMYFFIDCHCLFSCFFPCKLFCLLVAFF